MSEIETVIVVRAAEASNETVTLEDNSTLGLVIGISIGVIFLVAIICLGYLATILRQAEAEEPVEDQSYNVRPPSEDDKPSLWRRRPT